MISTIHTNCKILSNHCHFSASTICVLLAQLCVAVPVFKVAPSRTCICGNHFTAIINNSHLTGWLLPWFCDQLNCCLTFWRLQNEKPVSPFLFPFYLFPALQESGGDREGQGRTQFQVTGVCFQLFTWAMLQLGVFLAPLWHNTVMSWIKWRQLVGVGANVDNNSSYWHNCNSSTGNRR